MQQGYVAYTESSRRIPCSSHLGGRPARKRIVDNPLRRYPPTHVHPSSPTILIAIRQPIPYSLTVRVHSLTTIQDVALRPFYYAISKPAQRPYLSIILFFLTCLFLLGTAITAYVLFYHAYIPARGFSRPTYLQFSPGQHPYGLVTLPKDLVSNLPYDVKVALNMPRTPSNTAAGNFMLDLQLLAPDARGIVQSSVNGEVLAHETRPAILTYLPMAMKHVHKVAALPLNVLGLREVS
jgi:seipin